VWSRYKYLHLLTIFGCRQTFISVQSSSFSKNYIPVLNVDIYTRVEHCVLRGRLTTEILKFYFELRNTVIYKFAATETTRI